MANRLEGPGVLLRTIKKGDETNFPIKGEKCLVHLQLSLEDGKVIDNSRDRNLPFLFEVGANHVVEGLDAACQKMSIGQVCEVTIPSLYAFGKAGCPPSIPPDAVIIYRVEILQIVR